MAVPDLEAIATIFTNPSTTPEVKRKMVSILYGGQRDENDYHKTGFFFESLVQLLEEAGFCGMRRVDRFGLFPHDNSNADEHVRTTWWGCLRVSFVSLNERVYVFHPPLSS